MIDNCIINYLENYRACIHVLNLTYLMKAILVDCLEGTISHLLGVILPIAKTIDLPHVNSLLQGSFCPKLKESFFSKGTRNTSKNAQILRDEEKNQGSY